MRKVLFTCCAAMFCATFSHAQDGKLLNLKGEARFDYQREYIDGDAVKSRSGFKGKYFNLILNGDINRNFSYAWRQRLNKSSYDGNFFDATDWLYLSYTTGMWTFSGGKQVVGIGGYEYDRAPIDTYFFSEYCNNIACYQWGGSVTLTTRKGNDHIMVQVVQSPFRTADSDMYACNLMWTSTHGIYSSLWSANLMEYAPGKFINYIALGNQFDLHPVRIQLDLMNRATKGHTFFLKDCSVIGELLWQTMPCLDVFGKVSYDVNRTHVPGDLCVLPGTEVTRVSGGLEYYPLKKNRDIRLHATYSHSFGNNSNPSGSLLHNQDIASIGLTWKVDFLSLTHKLLKKHE